MHKGHTHAHLRVWRQELETEQGAKTEDCDWGGKGGYRTCTTDQEEFLSANIPGNVLRSSETHLISKTSGMHRIGRAFPELTSEDVHTEKLNPTPRDTTLISSDLINY